mgnify:CR=1 FL=1
MVFPKEEFILRRKKVLEAIEPNSVVILPGKIQTEAFVPFRQAKDFYYLCGLEVPNSFLLLDGRNKRSILYLPRREHLESSEGSTLSADDPEAVIGLTGVDDVKSSEEFLDDIPKSVGVIYMPLKPEFRIPPGPLSGWMSMTEQLMERVKGRAPEAEIRDISPILASLRLIKSDVELKVMRFAGRLSALAVTEAMKCAKPGVMEYQLAAVAEFIFRINGARGSGYPPIVASGPNIWYGHYSRNDRMLQDGDLVLMDCAPDYKGYTSDIGRMFPANGRYNQWQKELYGFVVEYHKALLRRIEPGVYAEEVLAGAAREMQKVLEKVKFSKPIYEKAAREMLTFKGHLSHSVGLSVHDPGNYWNEPLHPGLVFSVDPQMWVPEERLYIRVEDTVLVTENGVEVLTGSAPYEPDEVEKVMQEEGLLDKIGHYLHLCDS